MPAPLPAASSARASLTCASLEAALAALSGDPAAGAPASLLSLIGRTPVLALERLGGAAPRAAIVAKLETANPGGSVKDRAALGMVLDARARGVLAPGCRLVEPTAGNTGIGLALVGRALGHPVTVVMPDRYCTRKAEVAEALGATVVRVPGASAGMRECHEVARRLVSESGGIILDQFANPANAAIHELTTGPELWEQCGHELDAVVLGVGTGGTFTGVARALRSHLPALACFAVESQGSVLGGRAPKPTRIEGIGSTFVPDVLDLSLADEVICVSDEDAFSTVDRLALDEGLHVGPSAGAAVHAALTIARRLGPGRRVATLIPDGADRYVPSRGTTAPA